MDIRQQLADDMAREMIADIDRETIKRLNMGQSLVPDGRGGYEWAYVVDANGNPVRNTAM